MNPTAKPGSKPTSWRPLTPAYAARKAALEAKKSPQQ